MLIFLGIYSPNPFHHVQDVTQRLNRTKLRFYETELLELELFD